MSEEDGRLLSEARLALMNLVKMSNLPSGNLQRRFCSTNERLAWEIADRVMEKWKAEGQDGGY